MNVNFKEIVESLIENFLEAGDLAIKLREKGLVKKIERIFVQSSTRKKVELEEIVLREIVLVAQVLLSGQMEINMKVNLKTVCIMAKVLIRTEVEIHM